jgi:hypothetical protein
MKNFLLMFNHMLSPEQKAWGDEHYGPCRIIEMPDLLKKSWAQVPPGNESLSSWVQPFREWVDQEGKKDDLILIQGDFGATYLMVNHAFKLGLVPVYATTKRKAIETALPDGTVKMEHEFNFCRFRKYDK